MLSAVPDETTPTRERRCHCGRPRPFASCCGPIVAGAPAATAEDPGPLRVIRGGKSTRGRAPKRQSHGSMMERFEERWRRRREGGNGF